MKKDFLPLLILLVVGAIVYWKFSKRQQAFDNIGLRPIDPSRESVCLDTVGEN